MLNFSIFNAPVTLTFLKVYHLRSLTSALVNISLITIIVVPSIFSFEGIVVPSLEHLFAEAPIQTRDFSIIYT